MFEFLVTTSKGLDGLLLEEISQLCPHLSVKNKPGQVLFNGELKDAYQVCLWSRLANRVLVKLAEGEVNQAQDVYDIADKVNWPSQFDVNDTFVVDFTGTNRSINNTQFGALKIKDAIVDQFTTFFDERPSVNKLSPSIRLQGRMWRSVLGIYLDLCGQSLHQRHYRLQTGAAPVKEHLACAMLVRSGWTKDMQQPLVDPMCGAGTIAIEAAMMASNMAPGAKRSEWGFDKWKSHQASIWSELKQQALESVTPCSTPIVASDVDPKMIRIAQKNLHSAGVAEQVELVLQDAVKATYEQLSPGFVVSNPPYGERLNEINALLPVYQAWGVHLKQHFKHWRLSLLCSERVLLKALKLSSQKDYKLMNGKLPCQLVNYHMDEANCQIREIKPLDNDFINRFNKNLSKTKKWLKSQNTNCYRVYDADLPEYNVAVDFYDQHVVVQEYAAPKDVPAHKAQKRVNEVMQSLKQILDVNPEQIILKVREQQKGNSQYQKVSTRQERIEVFENGAKFWVNLHDYLDTGLFLDHRITRQLVQQKAKGKDVLNLFAYTGSVSVHAALGKARSITTVDMSNTYLDWAKDNFALNQLRGAYEFVQGDCLTWLAKHEAEYDLIFIDPPSFSNSKRMTSTWDVQRDHVALLKDAYNCLRAGGEIIFSNNLRQFTLDTDALNALGYSIAPLSKQTLPEDFKRNPKIHHCWSLVK